MTVPISRLAAAFRVGVTGTRRISPGAEDAIRSEIARVLALISEETRRVASTAACLAVYAQSDGAQFRMVSPLAEGSDRIAAEEALKAGYALHAPLPFSQSEYEKDFPESVEEFRTLLSVAEVLELDGVREFANESYREAGRFVVRNCDLLIAVWDGATERGPGGTAEIIRYAANLKVPVWWIDDSGQSPPRFVDSPQKLRIARENDASTAASADLLRYLEHSIVPPEVEDAERPGAFGRLATYLSRTLRDDAPPLDGYLSETDLQTRGIWRAYTALVNALAPKAAGGLPGVSSHPAPSPESGWWTAYFEHADRLSEAYGNRYRSSYVLIAALAVVVAASALGDLLPGRFAILTDAAYAAEAAAVVAIAGLVIANYYFRWHERWISYRLLAELFRKQSMLWTIGRSLPTQEVLWSALNSEEPEEAQPELPRDSWVGWYFAAVTRSAPTLASPFAVKKLDAAASASALIGTQIQYHRRRIVSSKAAASFLERAGQFFLLLTTAIVLFKIAFWVTHASVSPDWLRTLQALVSTLSASFVALRAYSELPLLAQQSSRMIKILKGARTELAAIEVNEPGASWQLGHTMNALALSMMQDVTGWMQLFRFKSLEVPDVH